MTMIEQFVEKVKSGEQSFTIQNERGVDVTHFVRFKNGQADCYLASGRLFDEHFGLPRHSYRIAAIVSGGKIYIVDWVVFGIILSDRKLAIESMKDVVDFDEFNERLNETLYNIILPKYYDVLSIDTPVTEYYERNEQEVKTEARKRLFHISTETLESFGKRWIDKISTNQAARMLYNESDVGKIYLENFEKQKDSIANFKLNQIAVQALIDSGVAAEDWEIAIADALAETAAKSVMVEFSANGKTGTARMESEKLLYIMAYRGYFDEYSFSSTKEGNNLLRSLDIPKFGDLEERLCLCNIQSIYFRGIKIYERKDN